MKKRLWSLLLSACAFHAAAASEGEEHAAPAGPPRWTFGAGAIVKDSPYAGEGLRVLPIPLLSYNGERFYFRGLGGGWRIVDNGSFELAAVGKLRFDGFNVDDLGRKELARNGIDSRRLEDRDMTFNVGLGMRWKGSAGELEVELLADATDTSGGQEAMLQYGYPFRLGGGILKPNVGITWQSEDMANYYYGTLDAETARGVVDYKPGAVTIPHVGFSYFRPLGGKWSATAFFKYSRLPDEIRKSPLVEADTDGTSSLFIGFSRAF